MEWQRHKYDTMLTYLFQQVEKVGYPAARAQFIKDGWGRDKTLLKIADYVDQHKEEYLTTREKIDADREELRGFLSGNYRQTPNTNAKTNTKTNTNTGTNTNNQVQKSNSQVAPNNKINTTNTTNNKQQQPKQQTRTNYFNQESFPSEEI